jgi:carboxylesterase
LLGPLLGYTSIELDPDEAGKWYIYRPQESLKQLMALINKTRKDLQQGIVLPQGAELKIYKSQKDATADPVSAVLLYKGLKTYSGTKVEVEMVASELHVFTRLHGRKAFSNSDIQLQQKAFEDMESRMLD